MSKKPVEVGQIGGMLGDGVVMEGTLTFTQTFRVDGEFKGKVLRSDRLVVGEKGKVNGEVEVNSLVVYGRVDGQVRVKGAVEIHPKGRIVGELEMTSPALSVMEGGFLEGTLKMGGASQAGGDKSAPKPGNPGNQGGANGKQGGKS